MIPNNLLFIREEVLVNISNRIAENYPEAEQVRFELTKDGNRPIKAIIEMIDDSTEKEFYSLSELEDFM